MFKTVSAFAGHFGAQFSAALFAQQIPVSPTTTGNTSDVRLMFLMFFSTALGGAVTYAVGQYRALRAENAQRDEKKEKTIIEHKDELIARLDAELKAREAEKSELEKRNDILAARETACKINDANKTAHIRYLERVLANNRLSFERWEEPKPTHEGTDEHSPLAPETLPNSKP